MKHNSELKDNESRLLIQLENQYLQLKTEAIINQNSLTAEMLGLAVYAIAVQEAGGTVNLWDTIMRFHNDDPITLALALKKLAKAMDITLDHEQFDKDLIELMAERSGVKISK